MWFAGDSVHLQGLVSLPKGVGTPCCYPRGGKKKKKKQEDDDDEEESKLLVQLN